MTPTPRSKPRLLSLCFRTGLAALLLAVPFSPRAEAGVLSNIRRSISSLWGEKQEKVQNARSARAQAGSAKQQAEWAHDRLEKTQQLLMSSTENYNNYFRQMRRTEAKLVEARHRVQLAEARYRAHKKQFSARLEAMQRYGHPSYLEVVFGSRTLSDLTRRTAMYQTIAERDANLQAQIRSDQAVLQREQNALMAQWQERDKLQKAANRERERIAAAHRQEAAQWRQLNNSQMELVAYAAAQEESSKEIGSMIGQLESRRAQIIADYEARVARERARSRRRQAPRLATRVRVDASGRRYRTPQLAPMPVEALPPASGDSWVMPARGRLSSRYGMRFHPILRRVKMHTGDDIAAAYGTPIRAARSGRVLWAGWKKAYGNTIIVDNGNGVTTLYGHASKLGVQPGQPVKAGEYIGNVGSTGWSTGAHLHFEVRKNGVPIDPTSYLHRK